jgi:hypothetical protein
MSCLTGFCRQNASLQVSFSRDEARVVERIVWFRIIEI